MTRLGYSMDLTVGIEMEGYCKKVFTRGPIFGRKSCDMKPDLFNGVDLVYSNGNFSNSTPPRK